MLAAKEEKYNPAIDLLRIFSIITVVLIHTSTKILEYFKYDLTNHPYTLFLNQGSRYAVPLFFLISAFVLELNYPKNFNYFSYLKKRFSRLFLPYLFWNLIYYYVIYTENTKNFFTSLLLGDSSYQLYFVPALFIFYLVFPLLHKLVKYFANKFIIAILAFIQIILLSIDYYFHPLPFPHPLSVFLLNFDIFILGILACHYQSKIISFVKKYRLFIISASIFLAFCLTWEGRNLYLQTNNYLSFYSNWRPGVFVYTLIFGSLLFFLFNKVNIKISLIKKFASYSFFVFFIHVILIEISWKYLSHPLLASPLVSFIVVLIPSYLLAYLVSKIPYLSRLTG
jgi:surface polysaccharide O-acyltransferase-like enzyme